MTQPLEFRFALTKDDYQRAARVFYVRQKTTWIFFVILVVFMAANWMVFDTPSGLFFVIYTLPLLLYLVFLFVVMPWWLGRAVQRHERLRADSTWHVTDERIVVSTPFAESTFDWGMFGRVIETPHAYLLVYSFNKNMFQIVPKRALATPEQAAAFERMLARKLTGLRSAAA
ncbi:MAG TPA: YcxB family protein [Herpetosiphonaceae bacterium]